MQAEPEAIVVREAEGPGDLDAVARLMRAFIDWHYERHAADRAIIDSYFEPAAFEAELRGLPGPFAPPRGRLLVAVDAGTVVGCVALRDLGGGACEMKRMFVDSLCHGRGVGRLLGARIVEEARRIGYSEMRLDTGPAQREAQGLYRSLGFVDTAPYYDLPERLRNWLVFMKLDLQARGEGTVG